jgi:hypothetical protein
MNLVVLGIVSWLVEKHSATTDSGVAGGGARVHARVVPVVLLDVRRWHDEVADLPRAATRVQGTRLVPLVVGCPARVSPLVSASRRGNALSSEVFWNSTRSHVLQDGEL